MNLSVNLGVVCFYRIYVYCIKFPAIKIVFSVWSWAYCQSDWIENNDSIECLLIFSPRLGTSPAWLNRKLWSHEPAVWIRYRCTYWLPPPWASSSSTIPASTTSELLWWVLGVEFFCYYYSALVCLYQVVPWLLWIGLTYFLCQF